MQVLCEQEHVVKTFLETLLRRKATKKANQRPSSNPGPPTLSRSFSHGLSVPVTNPSSPIALCTGRRCAAILRVLEDLRLVAGTVCDGNGLRGRQRVVWTP